VFAFSLGAGLLGAGAGGVTMTVSDAAGNAVLTLTAAGGGLAVTRVQYLAAGTYTIRYTYAGPAAGAPVRADLFVRQLSEGVGPYSTGTSETGGDPNPDPPPDYTYTGGSGNKSGGYAYYF
jgi:hypothetical protein